LTNISDGTGETNVTKVNANTLIASNGDGSTRLSITKLFWNVSRGTSSLQDPRVTLFWANSVNGGANTTIATLSGSGVLDLTTGLQAPFTNNAANTAGNIMLSTTGFTTSAAYTLVLEGKKTAGYSSRETTDDGQT
jgi:hypothetical protein